MRVDIPKAPAKSEIKDKTYDYFCSTTCKEKFAKAPESFAGKAQVEHRGIRRIMRLAGLLPDGFS
jgi:YHS domain-containing protein